MINGIVRKRRLSEDEDMADAEPVPILMTSRSLTDAGRHFRNIKEESGIREVKRFKAGATLQLQLQQEQQSMTRPLLATLGKEKLIHIILSLLDNHPEFWQNFMALIPATTIQTAAEVLKTLERRMIESFPYNRNGPCRNSYTFSRVRAPLTELIDTIRQYVQYFTSSIMFSATSFTFLHLATTLAHRLPIWDNEENNRLRRDLYYELNQCWNKAIQLAAFRHREGETQHSQTVTEWEKHLGQHNNATCGLFDDAVREFSLGLGFLVNSPPRDVPVCHHPAVEHTMTRLASPPRVVGYADASR